MIVVVLLLILILLAAVAAAAAAAAASEFQRKCVVLTSPHSQFGTESNNNALRPTQCVLVVLRIFMTLPNIRIM
jgi:membrane-anchored glycerophosphoryl diester phosphodiesterase (GDPDase)